MPNLSSIFPTKMHFFHACLSWTSVRHYKMLSKARPSGSPWRHLIFYTKALWEEVRRATHVKKKTDIPLWMLIVCKKKEKNWGEYASLSLCHATLQQQVKSANWNLFAYAKKKLRIGQVEIVRSHSQLQLQPQGAFHDLGPSSRKSSKLFGCIWGDIILFVFG